MRLLSGIHAKTLVGRACGLVCSVVVGSVALTGCAETDEEKQAKYYEEVNEASKKSIEATVKEYREAERKKYNRELTREERLRIFEDNVRPSMDAEAKRLREVKRIAMEVADGKRPPPSMAPPTYPSQMVDGKCAAFDGLPPGSQFGITDMTSAKFGVPAGRYKLDETCTAIPLNPPSEFSKAACKGRFAGFREGETLTVEESEQRYFGVPPGIYALMDNICTPTLVDSKEQYPASVREAAYKQSEEKSKVLRKKFWDSGLARGRQAEREGRPITPIVCQPPLQAGGEKWTYHPEPENGFPGVGRWWVDEDCKAVWLAPFKVQEVSARREQIAAEVQDKKLNKFFPALISIALMIGLAQAITRLSTGRGLYYWLVGKKKA